MREERGAFRVGIGRLFTPIERKQKPLSLGSLVLLVHKTPGSVQMFRLMCFGMAGRQDRPHGTRDRATATTLFRRRTRLPGLGHFWNQGGVAALATQQMDDSTSLRVEDFSDQFELLAALWTG
jgi:hypothetical protein